ncbi:MAG: response regulator [Alphaproteobacteria bacterium]|nr:response regulator [Alphaproteobacteria bacterium]MBV8406809.1 response regulator [Alphaproteobacteria bacterium]
MSRRFRFRDWPLRAKLAVLLVLSAVLPLTIAAVVNIIEARDRMLDQAGAVLAARAEELVWRLDTFNREYQLDVRKLARLPEVVDFLASPAAGRSSEAELTAILQVQPAADPNIRGAALLDMAGVVRATTDSFVGANLSYRSFIREALRRPEFTSSIYVNAARVGGVPSIAYMARVEGPDGKPIGLAALWVRASSLWAIMKNANGKAGPGSFAVLFDNNGIRIGHSYSDDIVFHPAGQLDQALIDALTADQAFGPDTRLLLTDVRSFPEQFERARARVPDETLFRGFAPVNQGWNYGVGRPLETVSWTVFYMVPEAALLAPIEATTGESALIAFACMVAALAVGSLYAGVLVRPIRALTGATMKIAAGDLRARVAGRLAKDELGRLGANFNTMAERIEAQDAALRAARDELELRVQERTAELVLANAKLEAEVAERARAETEARRSEQNLATTLNSIGDGVIATDTTGHVVRMNPVAEQLTGWSLADAAGRPLVEVFHIVNEETRQIVESPAERVLREGVVVGLANHTVLLSRNGSECPIADSGAPIRTPDGAMAGVVLVFRDQTEERTNERLRIRSVTLEAESLRAREASRLKSEFLANMSHELRTPLNAIIGFTQLIHDGDVAPDAPQYKEFLGDILASARHLLQLINDVLDLSRVEAGKLRLNPEPVNLSDLVGEVVSILRTTAADKSIRVETALDKKLDDVVLDGARFKQVLYNYISNAIKFTPEGGRVAIRTQAQPDDTFRLEVEDTGIGIAAEDVDRLFIEFQQLDVSAAKRQPGTGLGLALTKRLVEAQGGSVGVTSAPGRGSTFFAVFPRRMERTAPAVAPPGFYGSRGAPLILVIEDEDRDRASLVRILTESGYAVETAATGAQALARCNESKFDAITLDLILPDSSGVDVLRGIRASEKNRDVPVIVVTVVTERGAVAGFAVHDILPKPVDSPILLDSLQRAGVAREATGTVLIVDDDARSLKLMAATLDQLGYRTVSASTARLALEAAAEAAPAAVILDLIMPEMDGFEFLDHFRQMPQCRHTPVIVWTIKDITAEERTRLAVSARGIVQKGRRAGAALAAELGELLEAHGGFVDHG